MKHEPSYEERVAGASARPRPLVAPPVREEGVMLGRIFVWILFAPSRCVDWVDERIFGPRCQYSAGVPWSPVYCEERVTVGHDYCEYHIEAIKVDEQRTNPENFA